MPEVFKNNSQLWTALILSVGILGGISSVLFLIPNVSAQKESLWVLGGGLTGFMILKAIVDPAREVYLKPLLFALLVVSFVLSLTPFWNEVGFYEHAYFTYYSKTHSYWEAFIKLGELVEKVSQKMELVWLTWGGVSGSLLLFVLVSFTPLFKKPLKDLNKDNRLTDGPWRGGFMETSQVNSLKKNITGLPLGRTKGRLIRYQSNPDKGWLGGHHAVFAGSRAGKGTGCVIPAILDHDGPVVVVDIKGENFAVTKRYRESLGRKVVVLNPYSVIEKSSDSYNPLDYIRHDHLFRDLYVVADGIVKPEPGVNSHFSDLVRDLLSAAIEVTLITGGKGASLNDVSKLINSYDFIKNLKCWSKDPALFGERPAKIATAFLAAGDKEQGSIMTTLQRNTNWMASEEIREFLSKSTFDLESLLENKVDIFIVVPLDVLKQQENFLRLFVNLILGTVIRQAGTKKVEKPILMILDEFIRLGRMSKFLDIATVGAGCGLEAMFVAQDKGQVDQVWGREGAGTILGSCATVRVFGLGRTDSVTAKWVEEQIGSNTILTHSKSKVPGKNKSSESHSEQRAQVLTSTEVQEMSPNEMLCFIRSHKMLKLDRIVYYTDKDYKTKTDQNPLSF